MIVSVFPFFLILSYSSTIEYVDWSQAWHSLKSNVYFLKYHLPQQFFSREMFCKCFPFPSFVDGGALKSNSPSTLYIFFFYITMSIVCY